MSAPDIPTTLGSMLLGGFFASLLTGVVDLHTMRYYQTYKSDPAGVKALVASVTALDVMHTALIWAANWEYLIGNWGRTDKVDYVPWTISLTVIITAMVTFLVHCFFAHRIFLLGKRNWYMATPVVLLALLRLVSAAVSTYELLHYKSFALFVENADWIFTMGLSVSSAVDVVITGLLFWLFRYNRPESGHLTHVLDKLTLYAFETGGLTCLAVVVSLICWLTMPDNLVFLGLHFAIGKLYAISLLVTLTTREAIRRGRSTTSGERGGGGGGVLFLETRGNKDSPSSPYFSESRTPNKTEVQIAVEHSVKYDLEGRSSLDSDLLAAKK
ncbi:hypothetical protein MKEN_00371200 [Mycena kentingensis (nom. inval.)]|nr:hypothetical protein MKEN_00371200 [Mycena kentingensis (nom. inval.)]